MKARENPFRSDRIEQLLTFQPDWLGLDWDTIIQRFVALGQFCSIRGPHGSGKTTFLESVEPVLASRGFDVQRLIIRSLSPENIPHIRDGSVILMDFAGLKSWTPWRALRQWRCRRTIERRLHRCAGMIQSSHRRNRWPVLLHTQTNPGILHQCIAKLEQSTRFDEAQVESFFRQSRGNVRDALRICYDHAAES